MLIKKGNMKSKVILMLMALAMTMGTTSVVAQDSISGGKTTKPEAVSANASKKASQGTNVKTGGFTVNGHPATPQQKQAAKQMVKQAAKMAGKAAQVAATAVTNPAKAEKLGEELEHMGDQLEAMGDDLERMDSTLSELAEDTTFFYEGEDSDEVELDDEDLEEIFGEWSDDGPGFWRWITGVFGSGMGIFGTIMAGICVTLVLLLLFALFTSPIWVVFLLLFLIIRSGRKRESERISQAYQTTTASTAASATPNTARTAEPSAQQAQARQERRQAPQPSASTARQPMPNAWDENQETWKSGIRQSCLGIGFIICFFIVGWKILLVVGALLVCLGVAKLVIATTTKGRNGGRAASPQQESFVTGLGAVEDPEPATDSQAVEPVQDGNDNYSKTE